MSKDKIHALAPMLEALQIKQVVSFEEAQALFAEMHEKTGGTPRPFEISGNQWCALINLAVHRFSLAAPHTPESQP